MYKLWVCSINGIVYETKEEALRALEVARWTDKENANIILIEA